MPAEDRGRGQRRAPGGSARTACLCVFLGEGKAELTAIESKGTMVWPVGWPGCGGEAAHASCRWSGADRPPMECWPRA